MTSANGQPNRRTMRLPGSVAEIEASPAGPEVGAFFDLDGTLVAGFTGVIMTQDRLRRRQMSVGEFIGMVQAGLNHQLGRSEFEDLIGKGARMLRGNSLDDIDELAERLFVQKIVSRIYPEMRELVRAHMARGHTVVLSSSALTVQVEPVARFLGIQNVLSNKFETDEHGRLTGEVLTPIIWGPGKARAVQAFAADNGVDLSKSYFYADGDEDVALMYLVGNPRPTNPAGKLAAVAAKRGWPVLRFSSRSGSNPVSQLRTVAGVASMMPIAAGALGLGLLTRNRRTGVNFFTSTFGRTLLTATGVNLNVLGKENLTAQRPAVFIFNHRNQADPMIAGRAGQATTSPSVGKKELEKRPDRRHDGQDHGRRLHRPRRPPEGRRRTEEGRGARAQGTVDPHRAGGHPAGHHRGRPVQEGPVPHRDVGGNPDRADRDPQRRGHRRPRLEHLQPRHRRRRGVPADPGRRLDARQPVRAHRRGARSSISTRSRTGRTTSCPTPGAVHRAKKAPAAKKAPPKKAAAKKSPAKKAAAKKTRREDTGEEGGRQEAATKKAAAKGRP